jgi:hypothetical protein
MYENEQNIRLAFQNVFVHHPDGYVVLALIRNQLGANCTAPEKIRPDLIAFDHWLLNRIGIKHNRNFEEETKALLGIANDNDLTAAETAVKARKEREHEEH